MGLMKKKIKDLTLEELMSICANSVCSNCPIRYFICRDEFLVSEIDNLDCDEEIEVEDND